MSVVLCIEFKSSTYISIIFPPVNPWSQVNMYYHGTPMCTSTVIRVMFIGAWTRALHKPKVEKLGKPSHKAWKCFVLDIGIKSTNNLTYVCGNRVFLIWQE